MSEFELCLNTSTIRPTGLIRKIEVASLAGFQAIEPWNDEIDAYLAEGGSIAELMSRLADAGLRVAGMIALHSWIDAEGDAVAPVFAECERRMHQAAQLGARFIVASPPQGAVDFNAAGDRFAKLTEMGKRIGVTPSMEFLGFVQGVHTLESALRIARAAGPHAPIVADVFHLLRGGGANADLLTISGSQLSIFHINDLPATPPFSEQTDADRVMLGAGVADLPGVIANLRTIGYRGPLSLELFNPKLWRQDPLEVAKTGCERLKALIA